MSKLRGLPVDHPNLVQAVERLRRVQWAWAVLFAGAGILTILSRPGVVPVHWFVGALLLALEPQPATLGMTAIFWGISLIGLVPELNDIFAIDPISSVLDTTLLENMGLAFVRVILMVTAWNQFLFYRMLYGTAGVAGLEQLPEIPEVVPNRTLRLDSYSRAALIAGAALWLFALVVSNELGQVMLSMSLALAIVTIGLGVGVAFSPTDRRVPALASIGLGGLLFVLVAGVARTLLQ